MKRSIFFAAMVFLVVSIACNLPSVAGVTTSPPTVTPNAPTLEVPTNTAIPATPNPSTVEVPTETVNPPPPPPLETGQQFILLSSAENILFNYTYIDHPLIDNTPNAIVFATANWNPGNVGGTYNDHEIGVWYDDTAMKWAVYNQDTVDMPLDAAFNVLIPSAGAAAFVTTATAENTVLNWTNIDSPLTDNTPDAIVFVTANWNPGDVGGTYNDHAIGVWYDDSVQKWAVYNQDQVDMPLGAAFNVLIPPAGAAAFVTTATAGNTVLNWTYIDSPLTDNTPDAIVLATSNWNPGNVGGTYNDHAIGVWYDNSVQKWAVYNQDQVDMPLGAAFNILVLSTAP